PVREFLFSEMGHARAVKSKDWKYIAICYPDEVQRRIARGETFPNPRLDKPYLTRNTHLGYYSASVNPNYFDADQLYNLKEDRAEDHNVFKQNPEVAVKMQKALKQELARFPNRPFGDFAER
ncbi:hypothetical protein ACFL3F_05750, partial [Planctomycetota bacterium]